MDTLPKLLLRNAAAHPSRPALREKRLGIWRETSQRALLEQVTQLALGLIAVGIKRGDLISIAWRNRPSCIIAELAALSAGAAVITGEGSAAAYQLNDSSDSNAELISKGRSISAAQFEARIQEASGADHAFVSPGARLTHAQLISAARELRAEGELFCFQPLDTPVEQAASVATSVEAALCLSFPERKETQLADLREIGPGLLCAEAPFWNGLHAHALAKLLATTRFNRFAFRFFYSHKGPLADFFLFRALRDRLGLSRLRSAAAAGPLPAQATVDFFRTIGVPLRQL